MGLLKLLTGYEVERMPNASFRMMSLMFSVRDRFVSVGKRLDALNIEKGATVVDFGCGPGSYIPAAAKLVGENGIVYAVDIHPLAIESVNKKIKKFHLANVVPVLSKGYPLEIESHASDLIYAFDMFHHIKDAQGFLGELHRLLKPTGTLYIESGHQPVRQAKVKIEKSGLWVILAENNRLFQCIPKRK